MGIFEDRWKLREFLKIGGNSRILKDRWKLRIFEDWWKLRELTITYMSLHKSRDLNSAIIAVQPS